MKNKIAIKLKIEKFFKEQLGQYLLVIALISLFSWIFYKPFEALMFCVSHILIRRYMDKQYHCGTTALCLILTLSIAFFGIANILPVVASLLSAVPVCFIICILGYVAQDRVDLILYKKEKEKFTLDTCTVQQIERVCKLAHYKADKIKLAVLFFVEKKTIDEVWEYLNERKQFVERETVIKYKHRIKKDLSKFIKD